MPVAVDRALFPGIAFELEGLQRPVVQIRIGIVQVVVLVGCARKGRNACALVTRRGAPISGARMRGGIARGIVRRGRSRGIV